MLWRIYQACTMHIIVRNFHSLTRLHSQTTESCLLFRFCKYSDNIYVHALTHIHVAIICIQIFTLSRFLC